MPADAASWYDANPDKTSLYQGDVLDDIPLIFIPAKISKWIILRPNLKGAMTVDDVLGGQIPKWFEAHTEGQVPDAWQHADGEEYVAAKAKKMRVMLVTQSCDLAQRSTYQVAPVFPATKLLQDKLENLRANEFWYLFFLPACPPAIAEDSYADLSQITGVPKAYFKREAAIVKLNETTRRALQAQIAEFYGRAFGFNVRDKAPQTAEYACARCFYDHFRLQKKPVNKDNNFPECELCKDGLWVRVSDAVQEEMFVGDIAAQAEADESNVIVFPVPKQGEE